MKEFRLYQRAATPEWPWDLRTGVGLLMVVLALTGFRSLRVGQAAWRDLALQVLIMALGYALYFGYGKYREKHPKLLHRIRFDQNQLSILNDTTLQWHKDLAEIDSVDLVEKKELFRWAPWGKPLIRATSGYDMLLFRAGDDSFSIPLGAARFEGDSVDDATKKMRAMIRR